MKARGIRPLALNDSNPTRHGLAPSSLPSVYAAEPRGQRYAREAIASYINASVNSGILDFAGDCVAAVTADAACAAGVVTGGAAGGATRKTAYAEDRIYEDMGERTQRGAGGADAAGDGDASVNETGGDDAADKDCAARGGRAAGDDGRAAGKDEEGAAGNDDGIAARKEGMPGEPGRSADADDVYLLSSTSQAYAWLMKLLCDAGDAVLAPKPGYPLIESIARLECVEARFYQLCFDGSWFIDVPQIERMLAEDTDRRIRAIVVINPNNPTGSYIKPGEREALVALCIRYGIAIIADEVFFDYPLEPFDGNRRLSGEPRVLTFALDGFSKTLAAPHAKVGWIRVSGPADDVREARRRLDVIADDFLPMSELVAREIPTMLREAPRQLDAVGTRIRENLATLHRMLDGDGLGVVDVLRAEGGWNVLLRFPGVIDENDLVLSMIDDACTSGQPGYFFDMTSNGYLAISLLPEARRFERNVATVLDAVRQRLDIA